MKKALSLSLVLALTGLTTASPFSRMQASTRNRNQTDTAPLTNKDVVQMVKSGLGEEIVVAKIRSSPSNFDTSPAALTQLKSEGVPDKVILAMVNGPEKKTDSPVAGPETEIKIPDGTEIEIQLKNTLSGQEAKVGDIVDLTVVRPVQINGATVLGLLWGLKKGEKAIIPAGNRYSVFVHGDSTVKLIPPSTAQWSTPVRVDSSVRTYPNTNGSFSPAQSSMVSTADGFNQAGLRLFSQQRLAEAEGTFRQAISLDPQNALYHHNLATALNAQQRYKEAEKEAALAVRLAPNEETYQRDLELIRTNRRQ
jgi:hypothetical protein